MNKPHVRCSQTYPINAIEIELIHRVFVGIICNSVRTIDTGGGVMNDLYETKCNKLVVVHEGGAQLFGSLMQYEDDDEMDSFEWDMPLYSIQELAEM